MDIELIRSVTFHDVGGVFVLFHRTVKRRGFKIDNRYVLITVESVEKNDVAYTFFEGA